MKPKIEKSDKEIKEELISRHHGYLRLPKRVRDQYGNPKKYPNPDATAQEIDGKLVVCYSFPLDKLPKKKEGSGNDDQGDK